MGELAARDLAHPDHREGLLRGRRAAPREPQRARGDRLGQDREELRDALEGGEPAELAADGERRSPRGAAGAARRARSRGLRRLLLARSPPARPRAGRASPRPRARCARGAAGDARGSRRTQAGSRRRARGRASAGPAEPLHGGVARAVLEQRRRRAGQARGERRARQRLAQALPRARPSFRASQHQRLEVRAHLAARGRPVLEQGGARRLGLRLRVTHPPRQGDLRRRARAGSGPSAAPRRAGARARRAAARCRRTRARRRSPPGRCPSRASAASASSTLPVRSARSRPPKKSWSDWTRNSTSRIPPGPSFRSSSRSRPARRRSSSMRAFMSRTERITPGSISRRYTNGRDLARERLAHARRARRPAAAGSASGAPTPRRTIS